MVTERPREPARRTATEVAADLDHDLERSIDDGAEEEHRRNRS